MFKNKTDYGVKMTMDCVKEAKKVFDTEIEALRRTKDMFDETSAEDTKVIL